MCRASWRVIGLLLFVSVGFSLLGEAWKDNNDKWQGNYAREKKPSKRISNAVLIGANFVCADLRDANLKGANFTCADLRNADLCLTNLEGANPRNANLQNTFLASANLRKAELRGAYIGRMCVTLQGGGHVTFGNADFKSALYDENTKWLEGIDPKELGAVFVGKGKQMQKRLRIAVVPMTNTHAFFQTIKAGAEKAAKELGAQILWRGPESETDVAGQIAIMENFIAQKVDAIVLAPCERKALVPVVQKAQKRGIPVIVVDSALEPNIADCFVATDNFKGGYIAGETLAKLIGGAGKVGIVQAIPGAASVQERERGFREALKKFPKMKIASVLYGQSSVATAMQAAENMLTAHPDLKGIFAVNEISGVGTAQVLRARKLAGKVKLVAFDASETEIQALKDGIIQALIVQNPFKMGELGVRYAIMRLQGKQVPKRVDTGVTVVTMENFNEPKIQRLLFPLR